VNVLVFGNVNASTALMSAEPDEFAPEPGIAVQADEKPVGVLGSSARGHGLAMLRLDRVAEALAQGEQLRAGGIALEVVKPTWARFPFPGMKAAE